MLCGTVQHCKNELRGQSLESFFFFFFFVIYKCNGLPLFIHLDLDGFWLAKSVVTFTIMCVRVLLAVFQQRHD
jgi:hypothetical protein